MAAKLKANSETSYSSEQLRAHADRLQALVDNLSHAPDKWLQTQLTVIWALRTSARVVEVVEGSLRSGLDENGYAVLPTTFANMRTAAIREFVDGMETELSK